jgi:RNA 2',3'-cyclic 3'-phosphodiesterase
MRTMRAFVGVPLGEDVVRAATELSARLRPRLGTLGASAKWVPPVNMHVTLRFLGSVAEPQLPAIQETLGPIVNRHASFLATLRGLGCFPDPARPSVLWAGLGEGAEPFGRLAADVNRALDGLGFPAEDRPFHAHLTLARLRREGPPADLAPLVEEHAAVDLGATVVRDVVLFESSLRSRGPVYTAIWRGPLNPGGRREG